MFRTRKSTLIKKLLSLQETSAKNTFDPQAQVSSRTLQNNNFHTFRYFPLLWIRRARNHDRDDNSCSALYFITLGTSVNGRNEPLSSLPLIHFHSAHVIVLRVHFNTITAHSYPPETQRYYCYTNYRKLYCKQFYNS